ncbi:MAG: carboxylate-amine ligase [Gammaproteobacteria bacterium]|nr:carboxylate-amine ligase [Gammaproteobacteria bacterium]MDP7296570.1 carboxylate-amine ligase [Gammaproteobacteria bacterium]MDP7419603.1 carboxylate-amine ligase [Gammaproteobacteria bacterium]MDP7660584.1 carboxylate-amine ligase [Gammaproteobacteria bacterium]HJP39749.1 carboxylate-amine ligase [Gammaproteobacteria bacterium]
MREPKFTVGIEEEYLLVDNETMELVSDPPSSIMAECQRLTPHQVSPEFLRSQIEVGTKVCTSMSEVREDLARLRGVVIEAANHHSLSPIAASTHPFGHWQEQKQTPVERYRDLTIEMQAAARRLLICGMHVHVGIEDDELRIDLMNQMRYFVPHLLAMSTSSPFWESINTGLRSYRLTIFDALPRTGLPQHFESYAEYQRHVDILINAGLLEDATKIWWDIRPSARYQTLEIRIFDVCTNLDDAVSLAALTVCLLRMLYRLRLKNQRWRIYNVMLLYENRWRAMRYGMDDSLLDLARGQLVPFSELVEELLLITEQDAEALGCEAEVVRVREILARGSSAHRQVAVYEEAIAAGETQEEALRAVVRLLIKETAVGSVHEKH